MKIAPFENAEAPPVTLANSAPSTSSLTMRNPQPIRLGRFQRPLERTRGDGGGRREADPPTRHGVVALTGFDIGPWVWTESSAWTWYVYVVAGLRLTAKNVVPGASTVPLNTKGPLLVDWKT